MGWILLVAVLIFCDSIYKKQQERKIKLLDEELERQRLIRRVCELLEENSNAIQKTN